MSILPGTLPHGTGSNSTKSNSVVLSELNKNLRILGKEICCLTDTAGAIYVPAFDVAYYVPTFVSENNLTTNILDISNTNSLQIGSPQVLIEAGSTRWAQDIPLYDDALDALEVTYPDCTKYIVPDTDISDPHIFDLTTIAPGFFTLIVTFKYTSGFKATTKLFLNKSTSGVITTQNNLDDQATLRESEFCTNSNDPYREGGASYILSLGHFYIKKVEGQPDVYVNGIDLVTPYTIKGSIAFEEPDPMDKSCCDCLCDKPSYTFNIAATELTRPANATPYTAKDVVGTQFTLSNILQKYGGKGYVTKIRVMSDTKAETWKPKLHFYSSSPTAVTDNSPMAILYSQNAIRLGAVELPALATEDSGTSTTATSIWTAGRPDSNSLAQGILPVTSGTRDLYCILETLDAFTPTSGGKFYIEVTVETVG